MFQSKLKAACHLDYEIISGLLVGICCAIKRFVLPEFVKMCLHISAEAIKLNNFFHFKRSYIFASLKTLMLVTLTIQGVYDNFLLPKEKSCINFPTNKSLKVTSKYTETSLKERIKRFLINFSQVFLRVNAST